jgi:hypothetical protein
MKRVLADIDADDGYCAIEILRHGVLLVVGAPGQILSLAGQEHGRTIPSADASILKVEKFRAEYDARNIKAGTAELKLAPPKQGASAVD